MSKQNLSDMAYRHFIENVKDYAIYMLNPDGKVASWNEGARRAKGYERSEIVGSYYGLFYSEAEQQSGVPQHNLGLAKRNGKFEGEGWRYRKDGSRFWAHVVIDAIHDAKGSLMGFAKITRDISEQKQVIDKISWLARYDVLTGLPNRTEFFTFAEKLFNDSNYPYIGVYTIDLDKFKDINDTEGHHIGDRLLQKVADAVSKVVDTEAMVARFGGDEFVAIKPSSSLQALNLFGQQLLHCFSGKLMVDGNEIAISASVGISVYPDDGCDINSLIGNSDLAMYRAKANVEPKICWYEREMDERTRERNAMAADIRRGIKENQFFIHYQEKRNLKNRTVTGYEALLRWRHPEKGLISPDIFIPIAEETGAIIPLGYWIIEQVCQESVDNQVNKKISINISPVQLRHRSFIDRVREILQRTAYPLSLLEFEVTETAFIINKKLTFSILHQFQKMGISIALDDFGTGYSSLSTLRDFHFDVIKLDRSFLNDVENNFQARSFVRAIISLGNSINTPLVAEGVETEAQLKVLEEEGCSEIQGFLFGRPADILSIKKSS